MFTSPEARDATVRGSNTTEGETLMPHIIVTADQGGDQKEGAVMLRERVNAADFESDHFAAQLVERLGWAVSDAHDHERAGDKA
jgi:hypothetical protein